MENLEIGTRINYTGDMANNAAKGSIIAKHDATMYAPSSVTIAFESDRFPGDNRQSKIPVAMFAPGPGCRFFVEVA